MILYSYIFHPRIFRQIFNLPEKAYLLISFLSRFWIYGSLMASSSRLMLILNILQLLLWLVKIQPCEEITGSSLLYIPVYTNLCYTNFILTSSFNFSYTETDPKTFSSLDGQNDCVFFKNQFWQLRTINNDLQSNNLFQFPSYDIPSDYGHSLLLRTHPLTTE